MTALKGVSLLVMLGLGFLLSACLENGDRQKHGELQVVSACTQKPAKGR